MCIRDSYTARLEGSAAWVFGSEGQGVRPLVAAATGLHLRIPMAEDCESLNVAAAAAICLFETFRRRQSRVNLPAAASN